MTEPVAASGGSQRSAGGNRRLLILLGVGAGLLLVAFVLPGVLFGGGDDGGGDDPLPLSQAPSATTTTSLPGPDVESPPVETFEVFSTKNPFTPLVDDGGGAGGTETPPGGESPAGGGGEQPGGTAPTEEPVDSGGTEPRPLQRVALLEVFTDTDGRVVANVRVNDTVYKVGEGDAFAGSYQAVSLALDSGCGQFLFGDDRFRLCEGEELLK